MALGRPGGRNFDVFLIFPKCPKKVPGGPGGALGALFPHIFRVFSPLSPPLGAPYFSFYTAVISPPISPLKAAALWGAPPVHFTLVRRVTRGSACIRGYHGHESASGALLDASWGASKGAGGTKIGQHHRRKNRGL